MPLDPHITQTIRQWVQQVPQQQAQPNNAALLHAILYGLQAADAMRSAQDFKVGGHETNPMLAPFSHGGAPMMALGFGLGDVLRNVLLRHASQGTRNTADGGQALSNLAGILQTGRDMHLMHPGSLPASSAQKP